MPSPSKRVHLPRLDPSWYHGYSTVFWTHTIKDRATGWLDHRFHARFRELLIHLAGRYRISCPAYVLMPDHLHLLWMGLSPDSDQRRAARRLRAWVNTLLAPKWKLQHQPYDHVLRDDERGADAVCRTAYYVLENPVRAGIAAAFSEYPFLGAVMPGFPHLDPRDPGFREDFWKLYARSCGRGTSGVEIDSE